jgi:tetratricopeptide (TPR) repeat protein
MQTNAALKQAREEKRLADEKTAEAQRQRQRAEAHNHIALRGMIEFVKILDGEEWSKVPQRAAIREAFLEHELTFYRQYLEENSDDPVARTDTAEAYNWVGLIYHRFGNYARAEETFQRAVAILEEREADFRTIPGYVRKLHFSYLRLGWVLYNTGRYDQAAEAFKKQMAHLRFNLQLTADGDAYNEYSFCLSCCPITRLRNPGLALDLAEKAVELLSWAGTAWNTLGMAHYRAGHWQEAIAAVEKSIELRGDKSYMDFLLLSMAHRQLGHLEEARRWYKKGAELIEKRKVLDPEARPTLAEAATLLGIKDAPVTVGNEAPATGK